MKNLFIVLKPYYSIIVLIVALSSIFLFVNIRSCSTEKKIENLNADIYKFNKKEYGDSILREQAIVRIESLDSQSAILMKRLLLSEKKYSVLKKEYIEVVSGNNDTNCIPIILKANQLIHVAENRIDSFNLLVINKDSVINEGRFIINNLNGNLNECKDLNNRSQKIIGDLQKPRLEPYLVMGGNTFQQLSAGLGFIYGKNGGEVRYITDFKQKGVEISLVHKF